jgi:hypothetical protein
MAPSVAVAGSPGGSALFCAFGKLVLVGAGLFSGLLVAAAVIGYGIDPGAALVVNGRKTGPRVLNPWPGVRVLGGS